ncbi:MAG: sulfatase, partial [Acidobacteriota bacterium]|nr:sulfatase [Acidobacteriota bacterium]
EQTLSQQQLAFGDGESIRVELARWAGEYVRLRLGVSGSAGAKVMWHRPRVRGVEGRGSDPLASIRIAPEAPPSSGRLRRNGRNPDVVLVLLDAARFDAFSSYGGLLTTPVIDSLAADGTRFGRALAPSSWTAQSVPSVLTGLYPDALGVEHWGDALPIETPTLAELLAGVGYRTVLWSQHPLYKRWPSLVRGFEQVELPGPEDLAALPDAEDLFFDHRPTFAFVHLLPPHAPYEPPLPFRGSLTGWYRGSVELEPIFLNQFPYVLDPAALDADDRRYIRESYLENVAFADSLVGRIIQSLRDRDRYEEALIGVLSDHGEAFLEHGIFLHTNLLHQEFIQIPLVFKWPASIEGAARVIAQASGLVDLVPTLVDGLALETAGRGFQGRSVLPMVFDDATPERCHYAITSGARKRELADPRMMIECLEWKLHYAPITEVTQLYRIDTDPREQVDLAPEHSTVALYMRQELLRQMFFNRRLAGSGAARDAEQTLDAETIEQLKALGYLNGD